MGSYCVRVPGLLGTFSPSTSDRCPLSRLVNESQEGLTTETRATCDGNCEMEAVMATVKWKEDVTDSVTEVRPIVLVSGYWLALRKCTEGDRQSN